MGEALSIVYLFIILLYQWKSFIAYGTKKQRDTAAHAALSHIISFLKSAEQGDYPSMRASDKNISKSTASAIAAPPAGVG